MYRVTPPWRPGHRSSPLGQDALLAIVQLVDDCLALCEAAEAGRQDKLTSWQMRTQLGRVGGCWWLIAPGGREEQRVWAGPE